MSLFNLFQSNTVQSNRQSQMDMYVLKAEANLRKAGYAQPSKAQIAHEAARLDRMDNGVIVGNGKSRKLSQSGR